MTSTWLEKSSQGCGAVRMVMAKVYLRIFVETLAKDLPDSSVAKKEFLAVLPYFSSYAVFGRTFGTKNSGASKPAPDDDEENTGIADEGAGRRPLHESEGEDPGGRREVA